MFINNPSTLSNIYSTKSEIIKDYLIKNKIPLLSNQEGVFYFSDTSKLRQIINSSPLWIKWLV